MLSLRQVLQLWKLKLILKLTYIIMYKIDDLNAKKVKWFSQSTFLCYLFFFLMTSACSSPNGDNQEKIQQNLSVKTLTKTTIPVEGMSCNVCVASIKKKLNSMEGLEEVKVSLEHRNTTVFYEESKISPQQVRDAINDLGYKAGEPIIGTDRE